MEESNACCDHCGAKKLSDGRWDGPPTEPYCHHCHGQGPYSSILTKNYDHPCHRPNSLNELFGYDVEAQSKRFGQESWDKKNQWIREEHEYHYRTYQCCPDCHFFAHLRKQGHDVRRDLKKHFERNECLNPPDKK